MKISPSVLDANFEILQKEISSIANADQIHLDIMDGKYVPATTFRAKDLKGIQFPVDIEAHLMVADPESYFDEFEELGCTGIIIHVETQRAEETIALLHEIKHREMVAGICIDGYTGSEVLSDEMLYVVDQILVMSVKAGKGGQSFMMESIDKIRVLRDRGFMGDIEVDGGVNLENAKLLRDAGADMVVVGSFLMKKDPSEREGLIREFQEI